MQVVRRSVVLAGLVKPPLGPLYAAEPLDGIDMRPAAWPFTSGLAIISAGYGGEPFNQYMYYWLSMCWHPKIDLLCRIESLGLVIRVCELTTTSTLTVFYFAYV